MWEQREALAKHGVKLVCVVHEWIQREVGARQRGLRRSFASRSFVSAASACMCAHPRAAADAAAPLQIDAFGDYWGGELYHDAAKGFYQVRIPRRRTGAD